MQPLASSVRPVSELLLWCSRAAPTAFDCKQMINQAHALPKVALAEGWPPPPRMRAVRGQRASREGAQAAREALHDVRIQISCRNAATVVIECVGMQGMGRAAPALTAVHAAAQRCAGGPLQEAMAVHVEVELVVFISAGMVVRHLDRRISICSLGRRGAGARRRHDEVSRLKPEAASPQTQRIVFLPALKGAGHHRRTLERRRCARAHRRAAPCWCARLDAPLWSLEDRAA